MYELIIRLFMFFWVIQIEDTQLCTSYYKSLYFFHVIEYKYVPELNKDMVTSESFITAVVPCSFHCSPFLAVCVSCDHFKFNNNLL